MADIQLPLTSTAEPGAATPIRDESLGKGGGQGGGGPAVGEQPVSDVEKAMPQVQVDATEGGREAPAASRHEGGYDDGKTGDNITDHSPVFMPGMASVFLHKSGNDTIVTPPHSGADAPPPATHSSSTDSSQPNTSVQSQPHPPLKRFTSVNINKRFLEKTSSTSGAPLGGSPLTSHPSSSASASGSGQRRGASPSSRSPSTDRPASSRLVTAKLTAVSQPSTASTAGWLRPSSTTPGTSAAPTPPSSSPQPQVNDSGTSPPKSTSLQQSLKRREISATNGMPTSGSTPSSQQQGGKHVWGKVPPPPSKTPLGRTASKEIHNDFPTAAEAANGRKTKVLKAQLAAETAAAQTAAQKQAMIETAAAFRGAHLDANARHWDEMEDEDSDFLAGVIEFGDGTQYKIESKADAPISNDVFPLDSAKSPSREAHSQLPVTKEERFGEDISRSWPRKASPARPTAPESLPPLRPPPPHHLVTHRSPTDSATSSAAHSPHDGTSSTSRVLFNERSNRLEPWSNAKQRLGSPQAGAPTSRRDNRDEHPPFPSLRQQLSPLQVQGKDAPPHSHSLSPNVHSQRGSSSTDSVWKGGPPRWFGHPPERGRWGDGSVSRGPPSLMDEDSPSQELRRRESISSSDAHGSSNRDRSQGRDGRWGTEFTSSQEHEYGQNRDRGRRYSHIGQPPPPVLPSSLARDRSRDAGPQLPPHLLLMPPPPQPPIRGASGRDLPSHTSPVRRSLASPSASVPSLRSPSEQAPSISSVPAMPAAEDEGVDKNALVKDAMQMAIERAKKRKQEGEEEEERRLEAAERARKKAEALAAALEEKKKAEELAPTESNKPAPKTSAPEIVESHTKPNGFLRSDKLHGGAEDEKHTRAGLRSDSFVRPTVPHVRSVGPTPVLSRRPTVPPDLTPATQAESWRSKATPVTSIASRPSPLSVPSPPRASLPPTAKFPELDLSVKPDENIEVVDFCDLEKLMGGPTASESIATPSEYATALSLARPRRPVASDFFDDRPIEPRESLSLSKSDQLTWRRSLSKHVVTSPPAVPAGEELKTQTVPIFPAEDTAYTKDAAPSSPVIAPPFKRQSSQGDQASSSSTSQSAYMNSSVMTLRSPRTSHFKEAPMSTLTDTMSRIKGALVGMQSQDSALLSLEVNEKLPEPSALQSSISSLGTKANEMSTGSWREQREPKPETSPRVTKILSPPLIRPPLREVFDVTRLPPPPSPKAVWKTFAVSLPKESRAREAISRKQLHFWNLPHPAVRWDILSWDPPVEGMNKRELSRDDIFHRKHAIKGGKLRVVLPNGRMMRLSAAKSDPSSEFPNSSQYAAITAAGVKIKLPAGSSSAASKAIASNPQSTPFERPRDSSVPSWRRSATPLTSLKWDRQSNASANGGSPDHQLNTTSRSPPPEPSTPLPHFTEPKSVVPSRPPSAQSATVSLPSVVFSDAKSFVLKRPPGSDVAFFRTLRGDSEADKNKPLPRFTVTSELDTGEPADLLTKQNDFANSSKESHLPLAKSTESSRREGLTETSLPRLVVGKHEKKSSDDSASGTRPVTPPSNSWAKSPLSFSSKESPARSAPDPEHLKAVWSQASGRPAGSTSNSLKGIADDLPSIPFTVQDMKSEDGETPPPTAPAPPPSRLSLQEVTRAFQQVPEAPTSSVTSRPPSYAPTPLLSSGNGQFHRSSQPVAISLPPQQQHGVRPAFATYSHSMMAHSPSPTLMYAPGVPSPVAPHRMALSGPSPPMAHGMWLPTPPPPPSQQNPYLRSAGVPPPNQMMYTPPGPGASPSTPGQLMHRRMSVVSPGIPPPSAAGMYPGLPMDMQGHMHTQSPHLNHVHPVGHPIPHMHVGHMFSPPQHGQAPTIYAVPVGAGRGGIMPRSAYESYPAVSPHNASYQSVPSTSFVFQS